MKTAYLFPGQGAQHVGMGKDLYEAYPAARRIFDQAEEVTGIPLRRLCFEGPEEQLARTDVGQPAIFAASAATLAVMDDLLSPVQLESIEPDFVAGLSLGEYTALYAAGAIDFEPCLKLVTKRGELMQQAAASQPSAMLSVIGLGPEQAQQLCEAAGDGQLLTCANFNCPGQIVLSGHVEACERAAELAEQYGASGSVPLKVAGAFHSEIMAPAAEAFAEELDEVNFDELLVTVVANVDAQAYGGTHQIKDKLTAQLVSPVRWQQSMEMLLAEGVETFYEIGPGRVLAGLMRRIDRKTRVTCLKDRSSVEKLLPVLARMPEGDA